MVDERWAVCWGAESPKTWRRWRKASSSRGSRGPESWGQLTSALSFKAAGLARSVFRVEPWAHSQTSPEQLVTREGDVVMLAAFFLKPHKHRQQSDPPKADAPWEHEHSGSLQILVDCKEPR
ncbi:hypothetical protein AAFF_G00187760 [Aldrovandia affinis]|uniref:Uncharacterized protein n=1 Tax=Aldrovandia affinis TaxID=143900 RepID=A0AAD7WWH5_9TELE|nr:hypothetical protein AAFF_G00187760 [Aldrovandia affinis]